MGLTVNSLVYGYQNSCFYDAYRLDACNFLAKIQKDRESVRAASFQVALNTLKNSTPQNPLAKRKFTQKAEEILSERFSYKNETITELERDLRVETIVKVTPPSFSSGKYTEFAHIPPELTNIMGGMIDAPEEIECLKAISHPRALKGTENLTALIQALTDAHGHFDALSPEQQQQLKDAGQYIHTLDASGCSSTRQLAETLKYLPNLLRIKLNNGTIAELPPLPETVEEFDAYDCALTDRGIEALQNCKRLKKAYLSGNRALTTIPPLSESLEEFVGSNCAFTDRGIVPLAHCPKLKKVNLSFNGALTTIPELSELEEFVGSCCAFTDQGIVPLAKCPKLKKAYLPGNGALTTIPPLSEFLEEFGAYGCALTDRGIAALQNCKRLKKADLAGNRALTTIPPLSESLEEFEARYCDQLSQATKDNFMNNHPNAIIRF